MYDVITRCTTSPSWEGEMIPKYPILLCHGLVGIGGILGPNYFKGVREKYFTLGIRDVDTTKVASTHGIVKRAADLADEVKIYARLHETELKKRNESLSEPVRFNIIAHSMGGLDARYFVAHLKGHANVASITTIGTPHRGSALADIGSKIASLTKFDERVLKYGSYSIAGYTDLTREKMAEFNRLTPDHPEVKYFSYCGDAAGINPIHPLYLHYRYLLSAEGANDGLVSVESQRWGEVLGTVFGNHLELRNWYIFPNARFDSLRDMYIPLANSLAQKGL